jgi:hypothetical protein
MSSHKLSLQATQNIHEITVKALNNNNTSLKPREETGIKKIPDILIH